VVCPQGLTKKSPDVDEGCQYIEQKVAESDRAWSSACELGVALKIIIIFGIKGNGHEFDGTHTGLCRSIGTGGKS
jgi:hypothetical protein